MNITKFKSLINESKREKEVMGCGTKYTKETKKIGLTMTEIKKTA